MKSFLSLVPATLAFPPDWLIIDNFFRRCLPLLVCHDYCWIFKLSSASADQWPSSWPSVILARQTGHPLTNEAPPASLSISCPSLRPLAPLLGRSMQHPASRGSDTHIMHDRGQKRQRGVFTNIPLVCVYVSAVSQHPGSPSNITKLPPSPPN